MRCTLYPCWIITFPKCLDVVLKWIWGRTTPFKKLDPFTPSWECLVAHESAPCPINRKMMQGIVLVGCIIMNCYPFTSSFSFTNCTWKANFSKESCCSRSVVLLVVVYVHYFLHIFKRDSRQLTMETTSLPFTLPEPVSAISASESWPDWWYWYKS